MLNLTVHGARISMTIGLLATFVTIVIGTTIGIVAGYVGGFVDWILMRITDFFLVLPTFVLALILAPIVLDLIGSDALVLGIRANALRDRDRDRRHELGVDRPDHPLPGAVGQGADVRRPGARHRRRVGPHHAAATSCRTCST